MAKQSPRLRLLASVLLAAVVGGAATLLVTGGVATGASSSAQYAYGAPTNTTLPAITGAAHVGSSLSTSNGVWDDPSATFTYAWSRCDTAGANCVAISGATANTYKLVSADQGHTIRSVVTAKNATGSTSASSAQTAAVTAQQNGTIAAGDVVLPNLLKIATVTYSQNPIRARKTPTTMRIHVTDLNNNSVVGALVFVQGVPYSRIENIPETQTDSTGWATVQIQPTSKFPNTGYITMFVRARVSGQDLLVGSSSRRLVQATIAAPNGT
jgi:hypothetical protein